MAGFGLAHFARPEAFESITKTPFPDNTTQHIYIDGAVETVLGVGLAVKKTRRLATVGVLGYGAYLAANVIRNA